ncbi:MAG: winged helix-turn-helix domain-containing protein, partial [Candidatus Acidiferrum sp.]
MAGTPQPVVAPSSVVHYRFGTFELDTRSGELRRNGVKLRLQEQPFLVLRTLLESAGGIVAREDLHATLWPADTFVDFDTSLNTAIKRLREVLGDSADTPVYVETIPRRGYRFLAPVQVVGNGASSPVRQHLAQNPEEGLSLRNRRLLVMVGGLLLACIIGGLIISFVSPLRVPRVIDSTQLTFDGVNKSDLHVRAGELYFNERVANRVALLKVPAIGGTPMVLASSYPGIYLGDVSSDGSKLLVGTPTNLMKGPFRLELMDLPSGSLQGLSGLTVDDASWAQGGNLILARGNEILLASADGSNPRKLLTAAGPVYHLRYSPDGTRLRFTVGNRHAESVSIWEARPDGSGAHEILTNMTDFPSRCCGEWSPDGRYFYFQTIRNGSSRIWALAERHPFWARASAPVELTTVPPNFYVGGTSPDGKKLYVTASQPRAELVRYDSVSRQFVPFLSGISAGGVETSRDGAMLTYIRYPEGALWRSRADGSEAAQITGPSLRAALPHWSPDGTRIAFSGARPGRPWNIFLIASAGGPAEQVTNGSLFDLDPTWSPDGSILAFGQTRLQDDVQTVSIQMLDLGTRRIVPLTGSAGLCCPRWSPDGRFLVAASPLGNELELYEFATQKWRVLPKGQDVTGYIAWSPDSRELFFDTLDGPNPAFYRLRISDGHLETVAPIGDIRRYYSEFGPWTGIAADGSPLLVRDISNEEVYS